MAMPDNVPPARDGRKHIDGALATPAARARLRALDAMLGGVAHDLNNALSVVLMNLDVMQQDPAVTEKHGRRIDGMLDAMTGASALVRHLLNFSHSRRPEPDVVSIAETLPGLIELIQVAVGREIAITTEPRDVGPCCVLVDLASFEVAVVHIALQLAAAMHGGGTLAFHLDGGETRDGYVTLGIDAEGGDSQPAGESSVLDLDLVEHFARDAGGTVSSAVDGNRYRIALHLPACSDTAAV